MFFLIHCDHHFRLDGSYSCFQLISGDHFVEKRCGRRQSSQISDARDTHSCSCIETFVVVYLGRVSG